MDKLTAATITDRDIRKLREEAIAANDYRQVDICQRAITADGDTTDQDGNAIEFADWTREYARGECAVAINAARAEDDSAVQR
jgi:hypothetical protein